MKQMMLTELRLNPSVPTADEKRLSKQALKIWALFCPDGGTHYVAVWTEEMRKIAAQYQARLSELRAWLAEAGLTIDRTQKSERGNHKYIVRELRGSNYERLLKKRGVL